MSWQRLLPWFAAAGVGIGFWTGDFFLILLGVVLLMGAFFWRSPPDHDE